MSYYRPHSMDLTDTAKYYFHRMSTEVKPKPLQAISGSFSPLEQIDFFRFDASRRLDPSNRAILWQFLTPPPVAWLMASMFDAILLIRSSTRRRRGNRLTHSSFCR